MKHREIVAVLMEHDTDAKVQLQYRHLGSTLWCGESMTAAMWVKWLADAHGQQHEVRFKPEPVPDKVWYQAGTTPAAKFQYSSVDLKIVRNFVERGQTLGHYGSIIKHTIKTDDNGVETHTVEVVQ